MKIELDLISNGYKKLRAEFSKETNGTIITIDENISFVIEDKQLMILLEAIKNK